jgi:hypothetical protein
LAGGRAQKHKPAISQFAACASGETTQRFAVVQF